MSVKVTSFIGSMWNYIDEDNQHSGQLDSSTVTYSLDSEGKENKDVVLIPCPEGDAISGWPVGGGADARLGQMLHLRMALNSTPMAEALDYLKSRLAATDGVERFCLTDADIAEVTGI